MADFPAGVYSPRTKENRSGVTYTPANTKQIYAQDITKLDDEVVAIETTLGENPQGEYETVAERLDDMGGGGSEMVYKNGVSSRNGNSASGDQTIAHGLGATPKKVRIFACWLDSSNVNCSSVGVYNGTTTSSLTTDLKATLATTDTGYIIAVGFYNTPFYQLASIAVSATNITLSWTKMGTTPSTVIRIVWEVE